MSKSGTGPHKRGTDSTFDEDELLQEENPLKKSRSDFDEEDDELDEDALLGLSENEDESFGIVGGGADNDRFGGEGDAGFDEYNGGNSEYHSEEPIGSEHYAEGEADFDNTGENENFHHDEYEKEAVPDSTDLLDLSLDDVLDIDITDDSLITEIEEGDSFSSPSAPIRGKPNFSKSSMPPPKPPQKYSLPTSQKSTSPIPTKRVERKQITIEPTNSDEDDEEEEEDKGERRGRFKSERKGFVSLSGRRNTSRNIPDTLELSDKAKEELQEYERQQLERKQNKMNRGRRGQGPGGRGKRGGQGGRGGFGGRGGHGDSSNRFPFGGFHNRGPFPGPDRQHFGNFRGHQQFGFQHGPRFNEPRFGNNQFGGGMRFPGPNQFRPRGMEMRHHNPGPLIPIQPIKPLITLTNADFTEDPDLSQMEYGDSSHPPPLKI